MSASETRKIPVQVTQLPLGQRVKWARKSAGFSHDKLVQQLGRSNRGHLIKVEKGIHTPGRELRDAIADACGVPRELFTDDEEEESDPMDALMTALRRVVREEMHTRHPEAASL